MDEQNTLLGEQNSASSGFNEKENSALLEDAERDENDLAAVAPPAPTPDFHLPAMSEVKQQVGDSASQALSQAKQTAGQALDIARRQAHDQLTAQKIRAADSLGGVKESFLQVGTALDNSGQPAIGEYSRAIGDQVSRASQYLRDTEIEQLGRDAQAFAQQNPAIVIGGAFLLGFALARFFKSSEANVKSEALVPIYGPTSVETPRLIAGRTDIDLDDAFSEAALPVSAHDYVPGGVLGGAPA